MSKDCKSDVLNYMVCANRPYSLNDVVGALSKAHGKTAISKAMDELVLENALVEKVNGKQKVFVVPQDSLPRPTDDELRGMDAQIRDLDFRLKELKDKVKATEAELKNVQSSLTLEEVLARNVKLEAEIEAATESLGSCDTAVKVSPEEFTKADQKQKTAVGEWRKRKRMAMEIVDTIAEGYPKSRKQLMDDIGIETDEDRGFSIASFN